MEGFLMDFVSLSTIVSLAVCLQVFGLLVFYKLSGLESFTKKVIKLLGEAKGNQLEGQKDEK